MFSSFENEDFEPKTFVSVDVADEKLLGKLQGEYQLDIAIDHHKSNNVNAVLKYVDDSSASNTMIIYELIKLLNIEISKEIADGLYTGLATDTGCFKFSNTSVRAHNIAADLIALGCDFNEINKKMFDTKTLASIRIESEVFSKMEFFYDNKILLAKISVEMLKKFSADSEDLVAIPSLIRSIEGVLIGITMKEKEDGMWKVSVRAIAPANANLICQKLGGGGHAGAGGCALTKDYEESKAMMLKACDEYMKEFGL